MNYQYTLYAVISFILLSVGGWVYQDIYVYGNEKAIYRKELNKIDMKFHDLSAIRISYEDVRAAYDRKVANFDTLRAYMSADNSEFLKLLGTLREMANKQNIVVPSLSPRLENSYPALNKKLNLSSKYILRYPVEMTIQGDYLTIGAYLEEIITYQKVFNLGRISIDTDIEKPHTLTCSMILYAYLFREKPPR